MKAERVNKRMRFRAMNENGLCPNPEYFWKRFIRAVQKRDDFRRPLSLHSHRVSTLCYGLILTQKGEILNY